MPRKPAKPPLLQRLWAHFRGDPARLAVIEQNFAVYERPNLHLALEEIMAEPDRRAELIGVVVPEDYHSVTLSKLSQRATAKDFHPGPVEYVDCTLAGERKLSCVKRGVCFLRDRNRPVAVLLSEERFTHKPGIIVEAMAADREAAEAFVRELTRRVRHGKAFRGHVLSIEFDCFRNVAVQFHRLPQIRREEIILPEELLQRIERHTLGFSRHAEALRATGRHLKRGMLLHGAPGTGKTLTAMYLASQMTGRTVILLTGAGMGSIETACTLARMLEPSTVILEDVDLIGTQRDRQMVDANALLFELLNQMDGLAEDADILFVLTTNRPDVLEPALASRPGRIDQAIEIPLPDAACRGRLLELFARGLRIELTDRERLITRTEGASGAFIRELLRKAALLAMESGGDGAAVVRDNHVNEALTELLIAGGPITQSLLGAKMPREKVP